MRVHQFKALVFWCRDAKKALAFPTNSFSFSSSRTRRRRAVISASISRGSGRPCWAAWRRSRSSVTHRPTTDSPSPKSRATDAIVDPVSNTRHATSRRYSGVKRRRVPITGTSLSAGTHTRFTKCQQHQPKPKATTYRVNVRINGPRCPPAGFRPPPIGPTCGSSGPRAQDAFTETKEGHTARRPPDALYMPTETTEAEPRRIPPLVAYGNRAVGAEKPPYQQHVESYNPRSALLRPGLVDLGLSAVLPATEEHRQRRGQSQVLHANLDHGRARRLVGATAGNDTSGQRSGPTATQDKPRTPNGLTEHATT